MLIYYIYNVVIRHLKLTKAQSMMQIERLICTALIMQYLFRVIIYTVLFVILYSVYNSSLDITPAISSDFERSYLYILCYTDEN